MITAKKKTKANMEFEDFNRRLKKNENSGGNSKDSNDSSNFQSKELLKQIQAANSIAKEPEQYESSSERIYQIYQNPLHDADDIHIDTHTNRELHDSYDPFNREETISGERYAKIFPPAPPEVKEDKDKEKTSAELEKQEESEEHYEHYEYEKHNDYEK